MRISLASQRSLAFWEKFDIGISAGEMVEKQSLFTWQHSLQITIILDLIGHFCLLFVLFLYSYCRTY